MLALEVTDVAAVMSFSLFDFPDDRGHPGFKHEVGLTCAYAVIRFQRFLPFDQLAVDPSAVDRAAVFEDVPAATALGRDQEMQPGHPLVVNLRSRFVASAHGQGLVVDVPLLEERTVRRLLYETWHGVPMRWRVYAFALSHQHKKKSENPVGTAKL